MLRFLLWLEVVVHLQTQLLLAVVRVVVKFMKI
jgi:hypothetical protein